MNEQDSVREAIEALQASTHISMKIEDIASSHRELCAQLGSLDAAKSAAVIGGLLAVPALQSSNLRIEALQHLIVALSTGKAPMRRSLVSKIYEGFGNGPMGRLEDPAEDVLVGCIRTPRGNFRLLEGLWECASYHVQRFITLIEEMPRGAGYDELRESVYALLHLSEEVCNRAALERYQTGRGIPLDVLPTSLLDRLDEIGTTVVFSEAELAGLGISMEALSDFIFHPKDRNSMLPETLGHTALERRPLLFSKGNLVLALPTAVSSALRRYVIERMAASEMLDAFAYALARDCAAEVMSSRLVRVPTRSRIPFQETETALIAGLTVGVDVGRSLNIILLSDRLTTFAEGGFVRANSSATKLAEHYTEIIRDAHARSESDPDFVEGITLVVSCGVGRGAAYEFPRIDGRGWQQCHIGLADLNTLCWSSKFSPLLLWRLLDAEKATARSGLILQNVNGLLNLVAWSRRLSGHLVPHGSLPDDFGDGSASSFMMIEQNSLLELRHEVATDWDPHAERFVDGRWVNVRKDGLSIFKEDQDLPFYVSDGKAFTWPLGAYVTEHRVWWCDVKLREGTPGYVRYERWKLPNAWLKRIAPIVEQDIAAKCEGSILIEVCFEGELKESGPQPIKASLQDVRQDIRIDIESDRNLLRISIGERFEQALFNPENIAEQAFVQKAVEGIASYAHVSFSPERMKEIVDQVMPDRTARIQHAFRGQGFRDFVLGDIEKEVITIDAYDDSALKLGLGWKVRDRTLGPLIEGKAECMAFLNQVTRLAEDELCDELRKYDRLSLAEWLIRNHESAMASAQRWKKTSAAVVSLHEHKEETLEAMAQHDFRLNAVLQASRILVEMAICEAPEEGGRKPGELDLSRLMARAMLLFSMGGWSDAIRWGVMEPRVRVTALGDIHANFAYVDEVMQPFARTTSDSRVDHAVKTYAKHFEEPTIFPSSDGSVDQEFLDAWQEELGVSLDEMRGFVDEVENMGIVAQKSVLKIRRSELAEKSIENSARTASSAEILIDALSLRPRAVWRDVPELFEDRDRQPWRFRRRLSLIRRPLVLLDNRGDPLIMVAPGMLRDSLRYTVRNHYEGDFPQWQLGRKMKKWAGRQADIRGREFGQKVAEDLKDRGWIVHSELKIKTISKHPLDRDYGDIDVLAFSKAMNKVLIIECKDVQFKKTYGEIAEQVADFRGEMGEGGKPDYLRRHLDRVDLVRENPEWLAALLGHQEPLVIESHLVFSNPVPMEFSLREMASKVTVSRFDALDKNIGAG